MEARVNGCTSVAMLVKLLTSTIQIRHRCLQCAWGCIPDGLAGAVSIYTSCGDLLFRVDVNGGTWLLCVVV
jgi:hypothetical protein